MWEEDPRWQEANFLILIWSVAIGVVGGFVISLWADEWGSYLSFLRILGAVVAALSAYAVLVWTIGHLVHWLLNLAKKIKRKA